MSTRGQASKRINRDASLLNYEGKVLGLKVRKAEALRLSLLADVLFQSLQEGVGPVSNFEIAGDRVNECIC